MLLVKRVIKSVGQPTVRLDWIPAVTVRLKSTAVLHWTVNGTLQCLRTPGKVLCLLTQQILKGLSWKPQRAVVYSVNVFIDFLTAPTPPSQTQDGRNDNHGALNVTVGVTLLVVFSRCSFQNTTGKNQSAVNFWLSSATDLILHSALICCAVWFNLILLCTIAL